LKVSLSGAINGRIVNDILILNFSHDAELLESLSEAASPEKWQGTIKDAMERLGREDAAMHQLVTDEMTERLKQEMEALGLDAEPTGADPASSAHALRDEEMQLLLLARRKQNRLIIEQVDQEAKARMAEVEANGARSQAAAGTQPQKPVDVLSSLTTTESTRLPDGTVTTKVVLRQRFADGREEMQEKVHTYNEQSVAPQTAGHEHKEKGEKKKGWFWT
jgi:hypothetical protein